MTGEDCEREQKMERTMVENKSRGKSSPVELQPELWQQTQHWKGEMIWRIVPALDNSYDGHWDKGPSGWAAMSTSKWRPRHKRVRCCR